MTTPSFVGVSKAMFHSPDDILRLEEEYRTVSGRSDRLILAYMTRNYVVPEALKHARHGFSRRLRTLVRCIENTFEILPLDQVEPPMSEALSDININLQAFVFNVFGCVENLAWIWVSEKGLTKDDGSPIPKGWIGLRKMNTVVRKSFSPEFQGYLNELNVWFYQLEDYRHAVAHRIPLYVPPFVITPDKEAAYQVLAIRKSDALSRGALEEYDRWSADQDALGVFAPVMTHSLSAKSVVFHPQLLADFNTSAGLGWKMLEQLDH